MKNKQLESSPTTYNLKEQSLARRDGSAGTNTDCSFKGHGCFGRAPGPTWQLTTLCDCLTLLPGDQHAHTDVHADKTLRHI